MAEKEKGAPDVVAAETKTETKAKAKPSPDTILDFTVSTEGMDDLTKQAFYLLRRKATFGTPDGYAENLPDGKKMTLAEVEAALGSTIEEARIPKVCC